MQNTILRENQKFLKRAYTNEDELTNIFGKHFRQIISEHSFWVKSEKQFKAKKFKNFKHSIGDGFLVVWDNPTTPSLYITEMELERHDIDKHILPQIGDFISFIQSSTADELNAVRNFLYREIKSKADVFERVQREAKEEVYKLLDSSMEDLQILLVIDHITPELSIGLSQIEKAIRVKIRKIEISVFRSYKKEEVVFFTDSDAYDTRSETDEPVAEEYTLEYHLQGKSQMIENIVREFVKYVQTKGIRVSPMKPYIGFHNDKAMIFSCVVRKNSVVFYSKVRINQEDTGELQVRDVSKIGHYTRQLPTEIVLTDINQMEQLIRYFDQVYRKY